MTRLVAISLSLLFMASACVADQGSFELQHSDWQKNISHRNPNMRRRAAEQARMLPLVIVRDMLWNVLKYDNDDETVGRAAATLGAMVIEPSKADVDALLLAFDRVSDFYSRGRAAIALGTFAPKLSAAMSERVVKTFIAWLDNGSGNSERFVAQALGMFGGRAKAAIPTLRKLQSDHKWEQTRNAAALALKLIEDAKQ